MRRTCTLDRSIDAAGIPKISARAKGNDVRILGQLRQSPVLGAVVCHDHPDGLISCFGAQRLDEVWHVVGVVVGDNQNSHIRDVLGPGETPRWPGDRRRDRLGPDQMDFGMLCRCCP